MFDFLDSPLSSENENNLKSVEPNPREFFRLSLSDSHKFSKDTLDIDTGIKEHPLKSCILIAKTKDSDERIAVKKAKSVQFADTLGKPLKSVKLLAGSPDDLFALNFLNFRSTTRRSFPVRERNIFQDHGKAATKEENGGGGGGESTLLQGECFNFKNGFEFNELETRVGKQNVSLEKISFQSDNSVFGTIVVKNLCFEKHVEVRYTWDNWKTQGTQRCEYITVSKVCNADVFSFHIAQQKLLFHSSTVDKEEKRLAFAICFSTAGGAHWDSNDGENYIVLFKKHRNAKVVVEGGENEKKMAYL